MIYLVKEPYHSLSISMKLSRTIHADGIGLIFLERSYRAKRITITIRPHLGIRVAVPIRISFKAALEFVNKKKNWIRKTLIRIQQIESQQKALTGLYSTIDKPKAKKTLVTKLHNLAKKHGFSYNKVSIRNQKTRWGSCSHRNNISLNMKLIALSGELIDYVILHELVHTKIHNHSKRFWSELSKHVVDAKAMASRLREYDLRLL
jgi:predicted metal-dependent hydrolase